MFDAIVSFVREWGYLAVFVGSIFEGEVFLLIASASAAFGCLSIYKVFCVAFFTTVIVDQALFFVGYKVGTDWLTRKFKMAQKARDKVFNLLHRMDVFFIFAFRFIYGIRTISLLIIGSAKVKPVRFVVFNILSGFCWAFTCCLLGYVIADVVVDGKFDTMPAMVAISAIVVIIAFVVMLFTKARKGR